MDKELAFKKREVYSYKSFDWTQTGDWYNYQRMDEPTYLQLLSLVTPLIERYDTGMRKALTPHERLSATLRYLTTGRSYEDLKFTVAISAQALGQIIPETYCAT